MPFEKSAALTLFAALGMGQLAIAQAGPSVAPKLSELPKGATVTLPTPTAEYDGTLDLQLPGGFEFHPKVSANGAVQRYDETILKQTRTYWVNLETKETVVQTTVLGIPRKSRADSDMPDFTGIRMTKTGEDRIHGMDVTILSTEAAPILKDRLFTGKFFVTDKGVVLLAVGDELNTKKKTNHYSAMKIEMLDYHERAQNPGALVPPLPFLKSAQRVALPKPSP